MVNNEIVTGTRLAVEHDGQFLGCVEAYFTVIRFHRSARPEWFMVLPNGTKTGFTLPTRKQAADWLKSAHK